MSRPFPAENAFAGLMSGRLLGSLSAARGLNVWMPQCAAGAAAQSVARDLIESMGRRWREIPVRVNVTHSDAHALARAKGDCSRDFAGAACRFSVHELSQEAPFTQLDLIVCPSALDPLGPQARRKALESFHRALAPGGMLQETTGAAEQAPELFEPTSISGLYYARRGGALAPGRQGPGEEKFHALFAQASEAMLVTDAASHRILEANAAAQRLFLRGLPELLTLEEADLRVGTGSVRRRRNERRSEARLKLPHYARPDGSSFAADTSCSFLMIQGRPCCLWMIRDAKERLRGDWSARHEKKRESFMGEVVHELRSPVAIIQGFAETLRRGVRRSSDRAEFLKSIESQAMRMAQLIDRLLDVSASESGARAAKPEPIALARAVWETAAAFLPLAKRRRVAFKIEVSDELIVLFDPADLPHVLGNLLDNAVKYNARGGEVHVQARAEGGAAVLTVRDTGAGIPSEDLARVFDRFFRCERSRRAKGTGLGLAIVQAVVKANGGCITAQNHPEGGALMRVELPLAPS